jgi:hypothetical protein
MQTVELDVAFGGQSQLLSKPMLLKGPYGGRPAAVQMKKTHMTATVAQTRMEFLLMSNSGPPRLTASFRSINCFWVLSVFDPQCPRLRLAAS